MNEDPRSRIYRHIKTGGLYTVMEWDAFIESTMEKAVVYQSLSDGGVWVRPYAEFMDGRFKCVSRDDLRTILMDAVAALSMDGRSKPALSEGGTGQGGEAQIKDKSK